MQKVGEIVGRIFVGYVAVVAVVAMTGGLFGLLPMFVGARNFEELAFWAAWPMLGPLGVVCSLGFALRELRRGNGAGVALAVAWLAFSAYMTSFIIEPLRRW
ncbi:MAG: hypothetical protein AB7D00_03670 [Rhodospirillaceae bacterium]